MFPSKVSPALQALFLACSGVWALTGVVVDHTGAPIPDVQAHLVREGSTALTGSDGRFSLMSVGVKGNDPAIQVGATDGNVRFHLPEEGLVSFRTWDPQGVLIHAQAPRSLSGGEHSYPVGGVARMRPGLYFLEYQVGDLRGVLKLVQSGAGNTARWRTAGGSARSTGAVIDTLVLRKTGYAQLSVAIADYADNLGDVAFDQVAPPAYSVPQGTYTTAQTVSISSATANASIFYTLDGTAPTTASTVYLAPVAIGSSQTLKAIAVKSGWANSEVSSAAYTITGAVATPMISLPSGTYTSVQVVTITTTAAGASIYYTLDGTEPTTSSTHYVAPLSIASTQTLKAIAVKAGWSNSEVSSAAYTITGTVETPTFTPVAGIYTTAQSVTISSASVGAAIYYTLDGTDPAASVSGSTFKYSTPLSITSSRTLKAIAVKTGWANSVVGSAAYTITGTVATPTFTPVAGTYTTAQSVTLSSTTVGASIYYTTDGTDPTTASTLYAGALSITSSRTLKAIAVKAGWATSVVGSAAYTITGTVATPTFSLPSGTYTGAQTVTITSATPGSTIYYTLDGTAPTSLSYHYDGSPITVGSSAQLNAVAAKLNWAMSPVGSVVYTIQ